MVVDELDFLSSDVKREGDIVFAAGLAHTAETHLNEEFEFVSKFGYIQDHLLLRTPLLIGVNSHLVVGCILANIG